MTDPRKYAARWLTPSARATLATYGVTAAAWLRANPGCDRCGCADDRCMDGFHHDPEQDCGCLPVWIESDLREGRVRADPRLCWHFGARFTGPEPVECPDCGKSL